MCGELRMIKKIVKTEMNAELEENKKGGRK
jgi:hypothetical protein